MECLDLGCLTAEPEIRTWMQVVCLGGDLGSSEGVGLESGEEE